MDPKAVIESYVDEVVRRLPGRQRKDVGLELRALLNEELAGKEGETGRAADEAMALELLRKFGAPDEVADLYRPVGFTIIRPTDARMFSLVALGGVLVQWALSFPIAVLLPAEGDFLNRLGSWWVSQALGAFWWPGILISLAIVAALARKRWPKAETGVGALAHHRWTPRPVLDPDRIQRPLWAIAIGFFAFGAVMYAATPALIGNIPEPARAAFALDEGFVRNRGPSLLVLWIAQIAIYVAVLIEGRWRSLTRRLDLASRAASALLMLWFIGGGPILSLPAVDGFAKLILFGITIILVVELAIRGRRELIRVGATPTTPPA